MKAFAETKILESKINNTERRVTNAMDKLNEKRIDLIKEGIEGLLEDIATNTSSWMTYKQFADGKQIDDEMVFDWLCKHKDSRFRSIVGESDEKVDEFARLVIQVLNSEWYEEVYQFKVADARDGIMQQADLEATNRAHMPTWRP